MIVMMNVSFLACMILHTIIGTAEGALDPFRLARQHRPYLRGGGAAAAQYDYYLLIMQLIKVHS